MITSGYRLLQEYEKSKYNKVRQQKAGRRLDSRKQAGTEEKKDNIINKREIKLQSGSIVHPLSYRVNKRAGKNV